MNHIDEAIKQFKAKNDAKRHAAVPEHERRRSERFKAFAKQIAKPSEEHKKPKGTLKIKVKRVEKPNSLTTNMACPHSSQNDRPRGKSLLMLERDYEEDARKWQEEEKRQGCARLLNINI